MWPPPYPFPPAGRLRGRVAWGPACFEETGKHAKGSVTLAPDLLATSSLNNGTRAIFPAFPHRRLGACLVRQTMKKPSPKTPRKRAAPPKAAVYWSGEVTRRSNALDLEPGVFTWKDPKEIAASLKRSAEASDRKKADSFRSALSMLNFYINRAGTNLSQSRRRTLTRAKDELRRRFGRV